MTQKKNKSPVPSVDAAIRILDFLSRYKNKESSLSEISQKLDISKSTCLRILRVLNEYQMVSYNKNTKKYSLGVYLIVLGARASEFSDELGISKPYLHRLVQETNLTSVLVQRRSNKHLMYVAKEEPSSNMDIKIHVILGQYFPLTVTSFGKCFMAYMHESELKQIIQKVGLKKFTATTITDENKLKQELEKVREKGYAVSCEEHTPGVVGIASPIFDLSGKVIMSIACLGLSAYTDDKKIETYGNIVKKIAAEITVALGGNKW